MSETATTKRRGVLVAAIVGAVLLVVGIVIVVMMVTAKPSFDAVAKDCGAGVLTADNTLVVDPQTATTDTLVCVTTKLLSDSKDQFTVARAVDAGTDTTLHLEGYTIDVVGAGGGEAVSFSR